MLSTQYTPVVHYPQFAHLMKMLHLLSSTCLCWFGTLVLLKALGNWKVSIPPQHMHDNDRLCCTFLCLCCTVLASELHVSMHSIAVQQAAKCRHAVCSVFGPFLGNLQLYCAFYSSIPFWALNGLGLAKFTWANLAY